MIAVIFKFYSKLQDLYTGLTDTDVFAAY